jgi:hypothetical protein
MISIELSSAEIAVIRSWYEFASAESFKYSGPQLLLPTEQLLLARMNSHRGGAMEFGDSELACITDWMERAIARGANRFLLGLEEQVHAKITAAVKQH